MHSGRMCTARFGGHCEQNDRQTGVKTLNCPKLRLWAVTRQTPVLWMDNTNVQLFVTVRLQTKSKTQYYGQTGKMFNVPPIIFIFCYSSPPLLPTSFQFVYFLYESGKKWLGLYRSKVFLLTISANPLPCCKMFSLMR